MPTFDCKATAAVLRSGQTAAWAGHTAAILAIFHAHRWFTLATLLVWSITVYLAVRVTLDAAFFELLAEHPAEHLDQWLNASGLRKNTGPRPLADRQAGALRLWRALLAAVAVEIGLSMLTAALA